MHAAGRDATASPLEAGSLRRSTEFRRVLSRGTRSRRGGVTVVGLRGTEKDPRIGLVVRRSVGNAVRRNRARRRIRHALTEIPLEQGMDYVVIAEAQVVEVSFDRLCGWLSNAFRDVS